MESLRNHSGHFAFPTLLVLIIGTGAWASLDFSSTNREFKPARSGVGIREARTPWRAQFQSPADAALIEPVAYFYHQEEPVQPVPYHFMVQSDRVFSSDTSKSGPRTGEGVQSDSTLNRETTGAATDSVTVNRPADTTAVKADTSTRREPAGIAADSANVSRSADTTAVKADTTLPLDSLKLSAWLPGVRHTRPQAAIFKGYQYPLFLYSGVIQHTAAIDSTGGYVDVRETMFGKDIRVPLQIPLDEYIKLQEQNNIQSTWQDLAHKYTPAQVNELGNFMSGVTNIDIPIPANPVLSIFGPPRINLRISGAVDIHGAWRNQKLNAQTLSQLGNVTNQPDFKQDVQINVNGTVGDKLNIGANWDTQNEFDYENQLKIKYTGYDDEVIKSVEAGNVAMSTPSSFVGSNQALFGIKTQMQMGPLTLTALASQQKAQGKTLTVSGGSSNTPFALHAYQFSTDHYFIDSIYIGGYEKYLQSLGTSYNPALQATDWEVYVSQPNTYANTNLRQGIAVINLPPIQTDKAFYDSLRSTTNFSSTDWRTETGQFQLLDKSQYQLDPITGVLTLNSSIQSNQVVAIAFSTQGGLTYGTFSYSDTTKAHPLILNMIIPQNPQPYETDAWRLQLRNIYSVGGQNLDQNSLKNVQITYTAPGQPAQNNIDNINLLQVFGLDKTGANGGAPDGQMDWNPGFDINPATGEIILPYLQPFVEAFKDYAGAGGQTIANPDSFTYGAIYDTTYDAATTAFISRDRFLITGTYTSSITSHYNLGFNLVDGSVKVLLNGTPMTSGVDYTVDYVTGEVDIKNQAALQSGSNVQIQYETNDIFQIASKSLMGARADYKINDNTDVGFTIMGYTRQSPNDKVRLGEEPISNLILDADAGTSLDLPFVTKALDALPLIETAAPSKLSMHGEVAYMLPNPNTRTSVIPDDNNQGIAYIDDFEGSKKTIPLPINYSGWSMCSPPAVSILDTLYPQIPDTAKNFYRAWTFWYNTIPPNTNVHDIWPKKNVPADQQTQTVLTIGMLDTVRGQFNRASDLNSTLKKNPAENWGGMVTVLPSNANDLVSQNISSIEIWMRIPQAPGNGVMHVDLGQISEDVVGDKTLHTEDKYGNNSLASDTLDYGIDGLRDAQEREDFPAVVADPDRPWDPNGYDPDGDDYSYTQTAQQPTDYADTSYARVNGTEGNAAVGGASGGGRLPDTEDLNHNGTLDLQNSYFEYDVSLDTTKNRFIAGGGNKGWYQYVIPLQDFQRAVGSPSLSNVQYVRVWFNGMAGPMTVKIAEMDLVGSYWKLPDPTDSTMQVSVVNIEDTPGYTAPAPGLQPVDRTNPSGNILLNEQSLDLILNGLQDDSSRYVYKTFPAPQDFFNYHTMKVFVHGDQRFNYVDSTNYDADVFLRFGSDANNFYEYRQPIKRGWQDLAVDFARLTALKQTRDSLKQAVPVIPADNGVPGATYWLQGNPSLQGVTYFEIGVENPGHNGTPLPLVGEVWIDELRLTNVDNTPGMAYNFTSSIQLADFGNIAFNYTSIDPYFHDLTSQFGSRNNQRNWGINGSFSLAKLLPREWVGTSIPFSYSHTESFANPLYLPNSDILVSTAVQQRRLYLISKGVSPDSATIMADSLLTSSQTLSVNDQWSISNMRIVFPSSKWYVRDIVDNISMGYNWTGSKFRNTQTRTGSQWGWQYNAAYSVQFDPMAYFTPFPSAARNNPADQGDFQIRYLPNSFSLSMNASRSLSVNDLWTQSNPIVTPNFTTARSGSINWRLTNNGILNPTIDYRFNISSSLLNMETDTTGGKLRLLPDSYVFNKIFLDNGLINFGDDYSFTEQFSLSTQPKLPLGIQKYMDLQTGYNSGYQWTNSIQRGALGKGAGVNSSVQLGTTFRLKALADQLFSGINAPTPAPAPTTEQAPERGRRRGREEFESPSTEDTTSSGGGSNQLGKMLNTLIKVPFLDFESINVNFTSTNTSSNGGLPSFRPGMGNFFRVPFIQESNPELGPSQLYQLGLVSDPYSTLSFVPRKGFPFIGFSLGPTRRVGAGTGVNITDNFSDNNNLDIRTSRNLWTGARLDLSWHVGWTYNRNTNFSTDSLGYVTGNVTEQVSGQVSRSFFTLPPVFIFSMFKSGINQVAADYQSMKSADQNNIQSTPNEKASEAFLKGFETLPLLDKLFGQYMPRMNYSFSWGGLENLPFLKTFASQVSLSHAYQSTYSQNWHDVDGAQVTDAQTVAYGFQPLLGLNMTLKSFGSANISGSVLYNTSTQYSLSPSARTIAKSLTSQLSITADYAKRGFSLPLFGLALKNDIDISASYSNSLTTRSSYNLDDINSGETPIDGTSQTSIELRFKYDVSQRVTASIYYKNTRIAPTVPGSPIPGTTTNEAGIDVHVSISG